VQRVIGRGLGGSKGSKVEGREGAVAANEGERGRGRGWGKSEARFWVGAPEMMEMVGVGIRCLSSSIVMDSGRPGREKNRGRGQEVREWDKGGGEGKARR